MLGPVGHLQNETRDVSRPTKNVLICTDIFLFRSIPTLLLCKPYIDLTFANSFPIDGEASFEQISQVCGLGEPNLRRVMRYAMTRHVSKESRKGVVAHTATSKALAQIPMLQEYVGMVCEEMWPAAARVIHC